MIRTLAIAAAFSLVPAAAPAEIATESAPVAQPATPDVGLALGQTVGDVTLIRSNGDAASLSDLMGANGVALVFVRSADWCPYCKKQLKEIDDISDELAGLGWPLMAVSYDDPAILAEFSGKHGLGYELLSDPESEAIRAFNLLNTDMKQGTRYYGIPHPAIFFVDTDRSIRAVLREDGYKDRPTMDIVLHIAEQL
jgi:peroxiredoxin